MHRSEFPGDDHYTAYLEEVADHCSEGVEEKTNEVVGKIQTLENNLEKLMQMVKDNNAGNLLRSCT